MINNHLFNPFQHTSNRYEHTFVKSNDKVEKLEMDEKIEKKSVFFSKKTQIYAIFFKFVNILYTWGENFGQKMGVFSTF